MLTVYQRVTPSRCARKLVCLRLNLGVVMAESRDLETLFAKAFLSHRLHVGLRGYMAIVIGAI